MPQKKSQGPHLTEREFPLITIGITCFNAADTIGRAIESAMKQDWPNKEIVIVDDTSTDGSEVVLREMARRYPGLRTISSEANLGVAVARNQILAETREGFIVFFDDDDESRRDRLTKQCNRLIDYERLHGAELVLCYSNRHVVPVSQNKPHYVALAIGREPPEPSGPIVANFLFTHLADADHVWGSQATSTLMARRRTFLALDYFDESFRRREDTDLAVRAALRGAHFIAVNESLVTQYMTEGVDKSGAISLEYELNLIQKHKAYLKKEKVYWASVAMAHAKFHRAKKRRWNSRFLLAIYYCFLPPSALAAKLRRRLAFAKPKDATKKPATPPVTRGKTATDDKKR